MRLPIDARGEFGESPSGKAPDFDSGIRRFDPYLPSQTRFAENSASGGLTGRAARAARFFVFQPEQGAPLWAPNAKVAEGGVY